MMKKIVSLAMCGLFAVALCSSCKKSDSRSTRPNTFTFSYYRSGYGSDWVKAVTDYYMTYVDTSVYIELKESKNNESARTEIEAGSSGMKDLYQIEVDMSDHQAYLYDLTDTVYNFDLSVFGEEGTPEDRIEERWLDLYREGDSYYRLPQTVTNGWNWVYNKTTLDSKLGEGNWTLPRTTDEFFALGDRLYDASAYLVTFAGGGQINGEYTRYGNDVWFAQMLGKEGYNDYYGGFTRDEEGNKVFCDVTPNQILEADDAISSTYDIVRKLYSKSNGYVHPSSDQFSYTNVDQAIYNGKIDGSYLKAPVAFAYLGGWLETEIADSVTYGFIDPDSQEVYAMKMPVNSNIISRTPTINDDATLSKVIAYVDGDEGATLPSGVSEEDAAVVREARSFVAELICRDFVIPKNSSKHDLTTKFLAWLTTTTAQKIASKATKGVNVLPFGYVPTDEDMGFTISPYLKSVAKIKESSYILDESGLDQPYKTWFSVSWMTNASTITSTAFGGRMAERSETNNPTANIYNYVLGKYSGTSGMTAFKAKYPDYGK